MDTGSGGPAGSFLANVEAKLAAAAGEQMQRRSHIEALCAQEQEYSSAMMGVCCCI
jgi:hypothetical protein